jgi:pimeloyl-ACP methyl ester carboxylesterase
MLEKTKSRRNSVMFIRLILVPLLVSILAACGEEPGPYPWLDDLSAEEARSSGKRLIDLPEGLHLLERDVGAAKNMFIAIHGYDSGGYEWVYPLKTIDNNETATYFFRWDWNTCADTSAETLTEEIGVLLKQAPGIESVRLVGHSYGGLLVAAIADNWPYDTPVEIHVVASPLAGMRGLNQLCDFEMLTSIDKNVRFFEWRTRKELDGAFKDLDVDPQVIHLTGSTVIRLPETYRGKRLGHNWSISWVADKLAERLR